MPGVKHLIASALGRVIAAIGGLVSFWGVLCFIQGFVELNSPGGLGILLAVPAITVGVVMLSVGIILYNFI